MPHKSIIGKDGRMFIFRKGILFATVRTFNAHIIEATTAFAPVGGYAQNILTGHKVLLLLGEIEIEDASEAQAYVEDIMQGKIPVFDFQGIAKRKDGYGQKIIFRDCMVNSAIDIGQLLSGTLDEMALLVNVPPEDMEKFME